MPSLDMSDAVLEPTFLDTFAVRRRTETVTSQGNSSVSELNYPKVKGVVTAASPNDLERLEDEDHGTKSISIVTRFKLRLPSAQGSLSYKPDLITWAQDTYIVKTVDDYSRFGRGFIKAIATSIDYLEAPPSGQ